ncbi:hypothetical protein AAFC00_007094 [Neodothiora populina]|uniref:RING-type domain-containing protein n=1 Tax=Neodothiora populina TaxID=2781224 RepID=A0ABR3PC59_9PEZI
MTTEQSTNQVIDLTDSVNSSPPHTSHGKRMSTPGASDDPINISDSDSDIIETLPHAKRRRGNLNKSTSEVREVHRTLQPAGQDARLLVSAKEYTVADFDQFWDNEEVLPGHSSRNKSPILDSYLGNGDDYDTETAAWSKGPKNGRYKHHRRAEENHPSTDIGLLPKPDSVVKANTVEECLSTVLELFPDISHDYVSRLFCEFNGFMQAVLGKIVDEPDYPKERSQNGKAPEEPTTIVEDGDAMYMGQNRHVVRGKLRKAILEALINDFPNIPVTHIEKTQIEKIYLFPAYIALVEMQWMDRLPYGSTKPRQHRTASLKALAEQHKDAAVSLEAEYEAAKRARSRLETQRERMLAEKQEEELNSVRAKASGTVADCSACFDKLPLNRMICCSGEDPHYTCYECASNYVSAQVGDSKADLACPSGCQSAFTEVQLRLLPDTKLVEKLLKMQQDKDLAVAGVDDVVECPFCDFKAVCLPMEHDFEFRCRSSDCGITSCRRCQQHTHIPKTCEEAAQERSEDVILEQRHKIEEAMTLALVRKCNNCKKPFIKELGCNKMTCTSCGNKQRYVCSESVTDYNHFHKPGGCPLHDDVEERHAREIQKAEDAARADAVVENPSIDSEQLKFEIHERDRKATVKAADRRRRHLDELRGEALPRHVPVEGDIRHQALLMQAARLRVEQQARHRRQRPDEVGAVLEADRPNGIPPFNALNDVAGPGMLFAQRPHAMHDDLARVRAGGRQPPHRAETEALQPLDNLAWRDRATRLLAERMTWQARESAATHPTTGGIYRMPGAPAQRHSQGGNGMPVIGAALQDAAIDARARWPALHDPLEARRALTEELRLFSQDVARRGI